MTRPLPKSTLRRRLNLGGQVPLNHQRHSTRQHRQQIKHASIQRNHESPMMKNHRQTATEVMMLLVLLQVLQATHPAVQRIHERGMIAKTRIGSRAGR